MLDQEHKTATDYLRALVEESMGKLAQTTEAASKEIEDAYMAQDPFMGAAVFSVAEDGSAALPFQEIIRRAGTPRAKLIGTSGNLMVSRLMHMVAQMTPDVPRPHVRAVVPGAQAAVDAQNSISAFQSLNTNLKEACERLAVLLICNPYAGFRVHTNPRAKHLDQRFWFESVPAAQCGYEPLKRRFVWHQRQMDKAEIKATLPQVHAAVDWGECDPWEIYTLTEVFHEGFRHLPGSGSPHDGKCPVSYFISKGDTEERLEKHQVGNYVMTELLADNPIAIDGVLEPPPQLDIRPCEAATWIPLLNQISETQSQIDRERSFLNSIILYDASAFKTEHIQALQKTKPSGFVYLPVRAGNADRGVNATMRPVESTNNLSELLAVHQYLIQVFDDITGVTAMERGTPMNPRKSATEATSIVAAGNRRARRRMSVMADMYAFAFRAMFARQQEAYGETIDLPTPDGLNKRIRVPDPETARIAFDVSATDIGHLSKQNDAETVFNVMNLVAQVHAQFQGMIPRAVREMLRRTLTIMGIADADLLIDLPVMGEDPRDRLMGAVISGKPITVNADDNHQAFLSYYGQFAEGMGDELPANLQKAIMGAEAKHNMYIRKAEQARINASNQPTVMPGMGPNGVDANVAAGLAAFEPMPLAPARGR